MLAPRCECTITPFSSQQPLWPSCRNRSPGRGRTVAVCRCGRMCVCIWGFLHPALTSAAPWLFECNLWSTVDFCSISNCHSFFPDVFAFSFCKLSFGLLAARVSHRPSALSHLSQLFYCHWFWGRGSTFVPTHTRTHMSMRLPLRYCEAPSLLPCGASSRAWGRIWATRNPSKAAHARHCALLLWHLVVCLS